MSVDPIADKFPVLSINNYSSNNPIKNIDIYGLQGLDINEVKNFFKDINNHGLMEAIGNYFNFGDAVTGAESKKIEALSKINRTADAANKMKDSILDGVQKSAEITGDIASDVELGALSITAVSGGATSPITVPIAGIAEVVQDISLGVEVSANYAKDGKIDETSHKIHLKGLFGVTGKYIDEGVDALKISGYKSKETNEAVKSVGRAVNKITKVVTTDEKDKGKDK